MAEWTEDASLAERLRPDPEIPTTSAKQRRNNENSNLPTHHCSHHRRHRLSHHIFLLFSLLTLHLSGTRGMDEEDIFSSSPPPLISPTPSSSYTRPPMPTPSPYFINGLANTIRSINSSLLVTKSRKEPFQLHFRTGCSFGNILYDTQFQLGINADGNLTYKANNDASQALSILEHVSDGDWHSLSFNGTQITLDEHRHSYGFVDPEWPSPSVTLSEDSQVVLKFFDGFVGCMKLSTLTGDPIPSHGEEYFNIGDEQEDRERFSFSDYFQLKSMLLYPECSDLTADLRDFHPCPIPEHFILCGQCARGSRCEVTEVEQEHSNFCLCPQNASGKYCENPVIDPEAHDSLASSAQDPEIIPVPQQPPAVTVTTTTPSIRPGSGRSGGDNFTTPLPHTTPTLHPSPPESPARNSTEGCPCKHGGVCLSNTVTPIDPVQHICSCEGTGFYGERCELENTLCRSSPCVHGICQPKGDSYQCYCLPGFAGSNCQTNFNECLSNPCGLHGDCEDDVNNFKCKCHPGYTGIQCEKEINECESNPCQNEGRCVDAVANYTCQCVPGFEGHSCETNIDDCLAGPCANNGTCLDEINNFSCNCTDTGFEGYYCDREINECILPNGESPCQNGAECEDGIKEFKCICHPGYDGTNCETDILECASSPCRNNGTCLERSNSSLYNALTTSGLPSSFFVPFNYSSAEGFECICPAGFEGSDCSVDIDECAPRPCFNGRCVDMFNQFKCECHDGYKGTLCEIEINECESNPCRNRGECVDKVGDYACICPEGFGAQDCSVQLTGCDGISCFNAGTCTPTYQNSTHGHKCACANGWAGPLCQDSTTLSFGGAKGGYAEVVSDDERFRSRYAMSFRFRTTLSEVLIAVGQGSTYFMLTLSGGKLNLQSSLLNSLKGISSGNNVSNAEWHQAWVAINETHIALGVNQEQTIHPIQTEPEQPVETGFNTTVLGGATSGLSALTNLPSFVGCIQDIQINDRKIVPAEKTQQLIRYDPALVQIGCKRTEQCSRSPCSNSGACTDLWTRFECKCPRPFLGERCEHEYVAGTFGHENTSLSIIEVQIPNEIGRKFDKSFEISMFVRTREPRGVIFLLKDDRRENSLFLEAYVEEDGQLGVLAKLDEGKEETYKVGGLAINDGEPHLVAFQKEKGLVKINVNGTEHFRKSLPLKPNTPFNPAVMYIGGLPPPPPITTSTTTTTSSTPNPTESPASVIAEISSTSSELPSAPAVIETSTVGGAGRVRRLVRNSQLAAFKGVIQDVRVNLSDGAPNHNPSSNRYVVEFFPLHQVNKSYLMGDSLGQVIKLGRVLEGVVSDDACRVDPCQNGGRCETTWNDFRCVCPEEYDGKTCSHLLPCAIVSCPAPSTCKNLFAGKGFECVAEARFDGKGVGLPHYHLRSSELDKLTFNQISFRYRSETGGSLLHISSGNGSSLRIGMHWEEDLSLTPPANVSMLALHVDGNVSSERIGKLLDGAWHTLLITLRPDNPNFLLSLDGQERKTSLAHLIPPTFLTTLLTSPLLHISLASEMGNDGRSAYSLDHPHEDHVHAESLHSDFFRGCLGEVLLGPFRLPYVSPAKLLEINPENETLVANTAPTAFYLDGSPEIPLGCLLCYDNECQNGGMCQDAANNYDCLCSLGYRGKVCEVNIDECAAGNECAFGSTCVDGVANYTCSCMVGYTGWLCEVEINECEEPSPCNSLDPRATCEDRIGSYVCTCSEDYIGTNCDARKLSTCRDEPCQNGAMCMTVPRKPDGTNFTCSCLPGFTGQTCSQQIDYCQNLTCLNGATCINKRIGAECQCVLGFDGPRCAHNINDCKPDSCKNGATCIDALNTFYCNCNGTGFTGLNCEDDIDECSDYRIFSQCPLNSTCINLPGSFECLCHEGLCGLDCNLPDPCPFQTCENGGTCRPVCPYDMEPVAECLCAGSWHGQNCTERLSTTASSQTVNVLLILIPVLTAFLLAAVIAGVVLVRMARKKRATRGVYSPSAQEFCNPRIELDNVLKPPPEERLI